MTLCPRLCIRVFQLGDGGIGGGGDGSYDALITQLMNQHQPQSVPASLAARSALPRRLVPARHAVAALGGKDIEEEEEEGGQQQQQHASCSSGDPCSVCQDEFQEGAEVVELPCSHCYHEGCIMPWLETVSCHPSTPSLPRLAARHLPPTSPPPSPLQKEPSGEC